MKGEERVRVNLDGSGDQNYLDKVEQRVAERMKQNQREKEEK